MSWKVNPNPPVERVPVPESFPVDKKDWVCVHPLPRGRGFPDPGWNAPCPECRYIDVDDVPHVFRTYIWECEGCGTTTLVASMGGKLNPCDCDPDLMMVGWTAAGQYRHIGYARDLQGKRAAA